MRIRLSVFCLCTLFFYNHASAQVSSNNSSVAPSVAVVQQQYDAFFTAHPQLYTGPEYVDYAKRFQTVIGHQFFLSPEEHRGNVYYNNHQFKDIALAYDIALDQVVLKHPTTPLYLSLLNENVRHFTLDNHRFIRLVADSSTSKVLRTGYYEVLVDSSVQLLAKRIKIRQERANQGKIEIEFFPGDKLFVRKGAVYHPVGSKKSLTRLFADRGKEVQKYIQANKLKFKKDRREAAIVRVTRYYTSLAAQ
ncbi:hypothetical protein MTX78_01725 [Hymenobacter tibetensis]|uniref:Uncharacterized protein n=1 Tax=Hymenobacter tibetensis TaxID=497967 RepID=A0ABY4D279_9BACT|nr:hypothetical protein [Hymenobacter tibetensis]UOG75329.1 hypothetical protein MTX78_01725 [Hymenobacter tibetensis]